MPYSEFLKHGAETAETQGGFLDRGVATDTINTPRDFAKAGLSRMSAVRLRSVTGQTKWNCAFQVKQCFIEKLVKWD